MSKPVKNINQTPTEANLKRTLLELLGKKSLRSITVKELCENAKIYRSTFYSHYKSPEALFDKIQEEEIKKFLKFTEIVEGETPHDIHENAIAFLQYIQDNDFALRTLLLVEPHGKVYLSFAQSLENQLKYISKDFSIVLSREYTPVFMSHGILTCVMHWMNTNYAVPKEELADLLVHTLRTAHFIK